MASRDVDALSRRRKLSRSLLRIGAAVPLAFAAMAFLAPDAWAHTAVVTIGCEHVNFTFTDFPNKPGNTVHESVTFNGTKIDSQDVTFDGSSGGNQFKYIGINNSVVVASGHWDTNGVSGKFYVSKELMGCKGIL
jgi:hypothetical protein